MRDLIRRPDRSEIPQYDPETLFYRRAAGLEVRMRPQETWAEMEIGRADHEGPLHRLRMKDGAIILGLTEWRSAADLRKTKGISAKTLWQWVEQDLLFFSPDNPGVPLTGTGEVVAAAKRGEGKLSRRRSMWPTAAIATAVHIAPMPFMPRGRDLVGAEMVGARFASLERGYEVLGVTITADVKLGMTLRRLLPMLDGRHDWAALLANEGRSAAKVLALLDRATALEVVTGPPPGAEAWMKSDQVTWLGHAAVLVQTGGVNLLVDPLFFAPSDPPEPGMPPRFDPRMLPPIDAIFITHGDNDHLNPNSLALLPDVPVYVPRVGMHPPPYQVDMLRMLGVLGFTRVYEVSIGDVVRVGQAQVRVWPFRGENWDLDLSQATYQVTSDAMSVFLSADAHRMDDVYDGLGAQDRQIDLAFMGVSGCAEAFVMPPDLGYGNFYADWVPRGRRNEWVAHCAGPEDAAHSVARFRPRFAFGYAAGGAPFIRTEYSDRGDHDTFARCLEGTDTRAVALPLGRPVSVGTLADLPRFVSQR